ncbi:hypothetical protein QL285_053509 [Trifolium repens]|nr:hypothetical protein QL285_053509 [Trifolium repens]
MLFIFILPLKLVAVYSFDNLFSILALKNGGISPNDSLYLLLFDGLESSSVNSTSKVDDANFAGREHSGKCSLIITKGVSARSLDVSLSSISFLLC